MLINEQIVKESVPVQDYAAKVRREGKAEGRMEGQIEEARESLRSVLRLRFPKSAPIGEIAVIDDLAKLHALFETAMMAKSAAEFRRKLANGTNGRH